MPYMLINQLKGLMKEKFPSQMKTATPFLGTHPSDLPDEILDKIDEIADKARNVFGPKIQPSVQQAAIMEQNGFPIKPGKVTNGIWQSGVIETPKGLITYK